MDLLPDAVLVKLHDCKHVFLPVPACPTCPSFTGNCLACLANQRELEGVFAVSPLARAWKYDGREQTGQACNVETRQVLLAPANVLPLYSMLGMTATPGLFTHWVVPLRASGGRTARGHGAGVLGSFRRQDRGNSGCCTASTAEPLVVIATHDTVLQRLLSFKTSHRPHCRHLTSARHRCLLSPLLNNSALREHSKDAFSQRSWVQSRCRAAE